MQLGNMQMGARTTTYAREVALDYWSVPRQRPLHPTPSLTDACLFGLPNERYLLLLNVVIKDNSTPSCLNSPLRRQGSRVDSLDEADAQPEPKLQLYSCSRLSQIQTCLRASLIEPYIQVSRMQCLLDQSVT